MTGGAALTQRPSPGSELRGIGAVAAATGVSERTLRYYEELGLLRPSAHRAGGSRLYADADVERVRRIRELQDLMGFDLEEIGTILAAEDRLEVLRGRYRSGSANPLAVVEEAITTLESLRAQVGAKLERLEEFRSGLDARLERLRPRRDAHRATPPLRPPAGAPGDAGRHRVPARSTAPGG